MGFGDRVYTMEEDLEKLLNVLVEEKLSGTLIPILENVLFKIHEYNDEKDKYNFLDTQKKLIHLQEVYDYIASIEKDENIKIWDKIKDIKVKRMGEQTTTISRNGKLSLIPDITKLGVLNEFSKNMRQINKSLNMTLNISNHLPDISSALKELTKMSDVVKASQEIIRLNNSKFVKDLVKMSYSIPLMDPSPMLQMASLFRNITPQNIEEKEEEIKQTIQSIEEIKDQDAIFNFEAYKFLFEIETFLRSLIHKKIIEAFPKDLESKIPSEKLKMWQDKKNQELKNKYCDDVDYPLIQYSNFTDLKEIFEMKKNRKLFSDLITDEELKVILSKLQELDPIRKKIAHSRVITKDELKRIELYNADIVKIMQIPKN
ncbi:MAG: hypothetical protein AB7V77_04770 [Candidatus Woesearchaeota archaeon]